MSGENEDKRTTIKMKETPRDELKKEKKDGENYGDTISRIIANHRAYKRIKKIIFQETADSIKV